MHLTHPSFLPTDQPLWPDGKMIFSLIQQHHFGPSYWTTPPLAAFRSLRDGLEGSAEALLPLQLKEGETTLAEFSLPNEAVRFDAKRGKAALASLDAPVGLALMQRRAGLSLPLPPLADAGLESVTLALHDAEGDYPAGSEAGGYLLKDILACAVPWLSGGAAAFVSAFLEESGLVLVAGRSLREGVGAEAPPLPSWEEMIAALCALYPLRLRREGTGMRLETESHWEGEIAPVVISDCVVTQTRYVPAYSQAEIGSNFSPHTLHPAPHTFYGEAQGGTLNLRWPLLTETDAIREAMAGEAAYDRAWFLLEAEPDGADYRTLQVAGFAFNPALAPEAALMRHSAKLAPGPWRSGDWVEIGEGTGPAFFDEKHFRCRMWAEAAFALQLGDEIEGLGSLKAFSYDARSGVGIGIIKN